MRKPWPHEIDRERLSNLRRQDDGRERLTLWVNVPPAQAGTIDWNRCGLWASDDPEDVNVVSDLEERRLLALQVEAAERERLGYYDRKAESRGWSTRVVLACLVAFAVVGALVQWAQWTWLRP